MSSEITPEISLKIPPDVFKDIFQGSLKYCKVQSIYPGMSPGKCQGFLEIFGEIPENTIGIAKTNSIAISDETFVHNPN